MLDSDEPIDSILSRMLATIGTHLQVSSAQVYQFAQDRDYMDILAEWCNKGVVSYFDKTQNIPPRRE